MKKIALAFPDSRTKAERDRAAAAIDRVFTARTPEEVMACLDAVPSWVPAEVPGYWESVRNEILPAALLALKDTAAQGNREAAEFLFDLLVAKPYLRNLIVEAENDRQ